ncbi:MAG: anthranilate phosphoribosyltransferase [Alphaproteobacteria bacterium]|nr:anthranilate phosphoribosyltransferase [Alphaproteobacteria bacterium]
MTSGIVSFKSLIGCVAQGKRLTQDQAEAAFDIMMSGDATPAQIGGFLLGLRVRGESVDEIAGAARIMRNKVHRMRAPADAIDIVGTGGDEIGTFNVSTTAALVVAGCGVAVAKHGNRAISSKSGAADVLTALGVNIDADFDLIEQAIHDAKIGFMMAPRHHSAMRHVAGPRVELGTRTIFNLLGPLSNPAHVRRLLVGVFARQWVEPIAEVLGRLGHERAWVVHGSDGLDEITLTGPTHVAAYEDGKVRTFEITPEDAGLERAPIEALKGGDAAFNAEAMRGLLAGEKTPYRDFTLLSTAAGLVVAGKAQSLREGATLAAASIDEGRARAALDRMVEITNSRNAAEAEEQN